MFGFSKKLEMTDDTIVIDVRTAAEYRNGHLVGARNIDVNGNFEGAVGSIKKDAPVIVYCQSGGRSAQAASRMRARGFTNVTNAGGISKAAKKTGLDLG